MTLERPHPKRKGRPRTTTPEVELQACILGKDLGLDIASKRTGFDPRTIRRWMQERGMIPQKNPRGQGRSDLPVGFSYTLVFDDEKNLELFSKFAMMAEAGWPEIPANGDRVAEALRGIMLE